MQTLKWQFLKFEIANFQRSFTLLTKLIEIGSQTSSRALVLCVEIRQVERLFLRNCNVITSVSDCDRGESGAPLRLGQI